MTWRIAAFFGIAFAAIIGGVLGRWISDREPPTFIRRVEVLLVNPVPGGEVHVRYHVVRDRACATKVERVLFDAQQLRIPLPSREFSTSPGPVGEDSYVVSVPLSASMTPGPAIYRIATSYECNPLHSLWPIVVPSSDVHFEIRRP